MRRPDRIRVVGIDGGKCFLDRFHLESVRLGFGQDLELGVHSCCDSVFTKKLLAERVNGLDRARLRDLGRQRCWRCCQGIYAG